MIIPIGHDQSIRSWPYVTIAIIVLCTLMQAYVDFGGPSEEEVGRRILALASDFEVSAEPTPEQLAELQRKALAIAEELPAVRWGYRTGTGFSLTLITSAFVHGGWLHLIGNMLFLWLAGSAVEDRYGRLRFALFYALGSIAANYAFEIATATDGILLVGASGAVSACMGAFLIHFHRTKIRFWYLMFWRVSGTFELAAWFALPLWLAEQFLWVALEGSDGAMTGVAYAAHIGGFGFGLVAGFAMGKLFPEDASDDDVEYDAPSSPAARQVSDEVEDRVAKLYAALDKREVATVRTLSSRVILDLARANNDARIVEVYQALVKKLTKPPLTVGAFAAAALAADRQGDARTYLAIADAMVAEHPLGLDTPKVMWRQSQLQGDAGNHDLEKETLRTLAKRFPRDEYGQRASRAIDAG